MKKVHRALEKHHLYCRDCESIINHRQLHDLKCKNHYKAFGHMEVCKNVFSITPYKILHQLGDLETKVEFHKEFVSAAFYSLLLAGGFCICTPNRGQAYSPERLRRFKWCRTTW